MSVRVYAEEEEVPSRWIMIFVLLSVLAHVVFFLVIVLINRHVPAYMPVVPAPEPLVSMTLVPPPPSVPQKRPFIPVDPQNVPPKDTQIESNADTRLQSLTHDTRQPDSLMPNITSPHKHATDMHESPKSTTQPKEAPATPPQPKQPPAPKAETPPQPTQEQQPKPQPEPAKPAPPKPAKTPPPPKPQPDVDPATGLPVLPPLNVPPMAQAAPTESQPPSPPPQIPAEAMNMEGKAGISGSPSPETMATDLGRYKALVYQAVGSRWYPKVNNQFQLLGVGSVRIQYTIYSDGTVTTKVLDGGNSDMQMLLSISLNSITEAAPFKPFSPAMIQKVGESYTDDFTFSVYGNGN